MDADPSLTSYLELKEFLARNPCVKPRTFSRWKKRGLIDFIQPGGPNTQILVPEDALERMELRNPLRPELRCAADKMDSKSKGKRLPDWLKNIP